MELLNVKDLNQINNEVESELKELGFNVDPGSIVKLFSRIINKVLAGLYDSLSINMIQHFVTTAKQEYLEAIGAIVSCYRKDNEYDEDYRKRICSQVLMFASSNETAIRLSVLNIEGVQDVILKRYAFGAGSMAVMPIINTSNNSIVDIVKDVVSNISSFGEAAYIVLPKEKYIKIKIKILTSNSVSDNEKQAILMTVKKNLSKFLRSLSAGQTLLINEITEIVMSSDSRIVNYACDGISINNKENMYINQSCRWDERFVLSTDSDSIIVA